MDRRLDDFYERFVEQRIQKLNNPEQPGIEDSLPIIIEPLRAAPTKHPRKGVSNSSGDSGVNSPHILSPSMPETTDNSQLYLMPSTSRKNLLTDHSLLLNNSTIIAVNLRTRNLNTIVLRLINLTQSLCFALGLDEAINHKTSPFV